MIGALLNWVSSQNSQACLEVQGTPRDREKMSSGHSDWVVLLEPYTLD